jgi:hypothetical protein
MDYDVFPNVLDDERPLGMVQMRQPLVALRCELTECCKLAVGMEQPYSDIQWNEAGTGNWIVNPGTGIVTTTGVGHNFQDMPDFTGNVRFEGDYGHLQIAGIARKLSYRESGVPLPTRWGRRGYALTR